MWRKYDEVAQVGTTGTLGFHLAQAVGVLCMFRPQAPYCCPSPPRSALRAATQVPIARERIGARKRSLHPPLNLRPKDSMIPMVPPLNISSTEKM